MKRDPIKTIGVAFSAVAVVVAIIMLAALIFVHEPEARLATLLVFGIQCLIFGGVGAGFLVHKYRRARLREDLIAQGRCEMAEVVDAVQELGVTVSGRHPYRIICHIERDGVIPEYRSDMLPYACPLQKGDQVPVYLDRFDDGKYYVDVESVMPPVVQH